MVRNSVPPGTCRAQRHRSGQAYPPPGPGTAGQCQYLYPVFSKHRATGYRRSSSRCRNLPLSPVNHRANAGGRAKCIFDSAACVSLARIAARLCSGCNSWGRGIMRRASPAVVHHTGTARARNWTFCTRVNRSGTQCRRDDPWLSWCRFVPSCIALVHWRESIVAVRQGKLLILRVSAIHAAHCTSGLFLACMELQDIEQGAP